MLLSHLCKALSNIKTFHRREIFIFFQSSFNCFTGKKDLLTLTLFFFVQGVPIWSFHSLESAGSIPDSSIKILPALRWSQKRFGLDTVLERVVRENLLLHIDFERTKGKSTNSITSHIYCVTHIEGYIDLA